jgi:protein-glucosylgalactosylhydroxylysine glucosidase
MAVTAPISPRPVVGDEPDRLPAYVSNGMVGLRVLAVPLRPGLASSTARRRSIRCSVSSTRAGAVSLGGGSRGQRRQIVRAAGACPPDRTALRLSCAEMVSRFRFDLDDITLDAEVSTFASRSNPCLLLQEVAVEVSRSCELAMTALVATGGVPGRCVERRVGVCNRAAMRSRTETCASSRPVPCRAPASPTPPNCSAHRMRNGSSRTGPATATWRRPIG